MTLTTMRTILVIIALAFILIPIVLCFAPKETGQLLNEIGISWKKIKILFKIIVVILITSCFLSWQPQARLNLVESSFIHAIGYDDWRDCIIVEMNAGQKFAYFDVDRYLFEEFMKSESKGDFFNNKIKGKHLKYEKLWY